MVICYLNGQSGNNLFQYFLAYLVSKEKGYKVDFRYKNNQKGSFKIRDGYFNFNGFKLPTNIDGDSINDNFIKFEKHIFDWNKCSNHNGGIILDGYFQNYSYYKKYSNDIKSLILKYNPDIFEGYDLKEDDITVHLRLLNYPYSIKDAEFYEKILSDYKHIYIVSDVNSHHLIDELRNRFNVKLVKDNHFKFLCNSKNIVLSQSTYSWWASFISNAKDIYFPVFKNDYSKGIWYEYPKRNIDLYIEERQKKVII